MEKPPQLSPAEAYDVVQQLLKECGDAIGLPKHARDRMAERNVHMDDIRTVLVKGTVSPNAEWKEKFQNWNYVMSGLDLEGVPLVLVIAIEPRHCRITVITVKDN